MTEPTRLVPQRLLDLLRLDESKIAALNDVQFAAVRAELGELGYSIETIEASRGE